MADQLEGGLDVTLECSIQSREMRSRGSDHIRLSRASTRTLYWTPAQMIAHQTSNGCNLEVGDLLGSGTVSGTTPDSLGSLLEITRRGANPLDLDGELREFLADGDDIKIIGSCQREGFASIGFGACTGTIVPAGPIAERAQCLDPFPSKDIIMSTSRYMSGFGNSFETEALPDALPVGRNSPQQANYGLYAEQLSGSAFTAPRGTNERSWLYRIRPSVKHTTRFTVVDAPLLRSAPNPGQSKLPIGQYRWGPVAIPQEKLTFTTGLFTVTTAGDVEAQSGMAAHLLFVTASMTNEYFCNADGEFLVVAQQGGLRFRTEFGVIEIEPGEICVIPRGVIFRVELMNGASRAYVCENYGGSFTLPERGPIGANCLANSRDFLTPVAAYEDRDEPSTVYFKWCGELFKTEIGQSPLDVVAWHGNYAPYKYDLRRFSPVGAISFDHPDPSIYTVLTSPSETSGTANIDFVIFPERWAVAENTFRPPWYHRNIMSEFMGLVYGVYDAKPEGFVPGGMSLHNMMLPHGPDAAAFEHATTVELKPHKIANTLAFMFESRFPQKLTRYSSELSSRDDGYVDCWSDLKRRFAR